MTQEVRVPTLGESVAEATIGTWFVKKGEMVAVDQPLVELETDKVTVEVNASDAGRLTEILVEQGETVEVGTLLAKIDESAGGALTAPVAAKPSVAAKPQPVETPKPMPPTAAAAPLSPAVRRLVAENDLDPAALNGTGKGGRVTKGDVLQVLAEGAGAALQPQAPASPAKQPPAGVGEREERVPMSRLRQRVAERLKEAQNTAAILTTFNEVDMSAVMAARRTYRDVFERKHKVRLGFMSFFIKACVTALKEIPAVNAEIQGSDIIYKNHYDLGVAVSTPTGLVVPVLRDADIKGFADIEKEINDFGLRARDGKLTLNELQGGTFTISNGGVFGSLMSTPILNPPQSGILGMHKIQERPIAVDGAVVVRPMMYLALSYDHRIIDGREAVTFLVRVKEGIEDPQRLLLDL